MSVPAFNTVTWFQVGADAPDEARRFYGDMFGWKFALDPDDNGYDLISYPGADARAAASRTPRIRPRTTPCSSCSSRTSTPPARRPRSTAARSSCPV